MYKTLRKVVLLFLLTLSVVCGSLFIAACDTLDGGDGKVTYSVTVTLNEDVEDVTLTSLKAKWMRGVNPASEEVSLNAQGKAYVELDAGNYDVELIGLPETAEYVKASVSATKPDAKITVSAVKPTALPAPVISIDEDTGVISWSAVTGAVSYEVYDDSNDEKLDTVTTTTYTIEKTEVAEYSFYVIAVAGSSDKLHLNSGKSNVESYIKYGLFETAPEIYRYDTMISWNPVEGAGSYAVYMNGVKVDTVYGTTYTITETEYGVYVFTVKAISLDGLYRSEDSNSTTYIITAPINITVDTPVTVSFTGSYPEYIFIVDSSLPRNVYYKISAKLANGDNPAENITVADTGNEDHYIILYAANGYSDEIIISGESLRVSYFDVVENYEVIFTLETSNTEIEDPNLPSVDETPVIGVGAWATNTQKIPANGSFNFEPSEQMEAGEYYIYVTVNNDIVVDFEMSANGTPLTLGSDGKTFSGMIEVTAGRDRLNDIVVSSTSDQIINVTARLEEEPLAEGLVPEGDGISFEIAANSYVAVAIDNSVELAEYELRVINFTWTEVDGTVTVSLDSAEGAETALTWTGMYYSLNITLTQRTIYVHNNSAEVLSCSIRLNNVEGGGDDDGPAASTGPIEVNTEYVVKLSGGDSVFISLGETVTVGDYLLVISGDGLADLGSVGIVGMISFVYGAGDPPVLNASNGYRAMVTNEGQPWDELSIGTENYAKVKATLTVMLIPASQVLTPDTDLSVNMNDFINGTIVYLSSEVKGQVTITLTGCNEAVTLFANDSTFPLGELKSGNGYSVTVTLDASVTCLRFEYWNGGNYTVHVTLVKD